jgi:hypothetical protein
MLLLYKEKSKRAGGMAQVVEHLPSKVLNTRPCVQTPVPQKKKKERKKERSQALVAHAYNPSYLGG